MSCTRRLRSSPASHTRASTARSHQGDVAHVCACGQRRPAMPLTRRSHPVCLQPPGASTRPLMWPEIVSRDPQLRSARVLRFGLASLGRLMGSAAEKLSDSMLAMRFAHRGWLLGVDFVLVRRTLDVLSNVDARPSLASGSRIYTPATRPVGLKLIGVRARAW